ncbi:MAG TPA: MmgE/PrpD family protein, partial [Chloroflexota bacterium]
YRPERIQRADAQALLRRVIVRPSEAYSRRFPDEMPCRVAVILRGGEVLTREKRDYEGFFTRPMSWDAVRQKFERLSAPYVDASDREAIVRAVEHLESLAVADVTSLLARVRVPRG